VTINHDAVRTTATEGIGQSSGTTINISQGTDTAAKGIFVVKTHPTLERLSVPTNTLSNGDMDLYRFKITAPAEGDIGLYKFTFRVSSTTVATTSQFRVFAYSDSNFSTQAYAANPINANDVDCVGSPSLEGSANDSCGSNDNDLPVGFNLWSVGGPSGNAIASSTTVGIFFDPVSNNASLPGREAINVPAGQSRYFRLVGNITRSTVGDSFQVALVGDLEQRPDYTGGRIPLSTLDVADTIATSSNFVWSPNTTTTAATTTNDWLSGYLIPGLPSTEMAPQTFSK
jgi:hypothetical protein